MKKNGKSEEQMSRLYSLWCGMRSRCNYKGNIHYKNYGGRGIKVCDEWNNYWNFREWAYSNGYNKTAKRGECTLDRINVNGNYEPSNCRFVDNKFQCNNKTTNIKITFKGKKYTLKQWSEITGIKVATLQQRYHKGWNVEKILTLNPVIGRNQYSKD